MTPLLTRSANGGPVTKQLLVDSPVALAADGPMVVNAGGWGVYRTRYGSKELAAIAGSLERLDELERAVLFADGWASLFAGHSIWNDFLALARGLGDVDEPATWNVVAQAFEFANRVANEDQRIRLAQSVVEIFGPQFERLGWAPSDGEGELAAQVRATSISVLGTLGRVTAVREGALERFDKNELDGDIARAVLRVVGAVNRPGDYDTFLSRFRVADSPQIQQRYQWGLSDFGEEALALDAAEKCFSEFRTQDGPIVLGFLSRNATTGPAVWRYITSRWDEAMVKFPVNGRDRLCGGIPFLIADRSLASDIESFHRSHPIDGEQRTIEQLLERMRVGLDFADAIRPQL
jgi:hypothetical protein